MKNYFYNNDTTYNQIYGKEYISKDELITSLMNKYDITKGEIQIEVDRLRSIPKENIFITLYMIPEGSQRPRTGGGHFYVKGANKLKKVMQSLHTDGKIICTGTDLDIRFYLPTPIGKLTPMETILAELGELYPEVKPDFDNLPKGYIDALNKIILLDDSLIYHANITKYYSIKPRIEIFMSYYTEFTCDYNAQKVQKSINSILQEKP